MNLDRIHEENFWSSLYQLTTHNHPEQTNEKDTSDQLAKISKLVNENKEYWQRTSSNPFRGSSLASLSERIEKISCQNPTTHALTNSLRKAAENHAFPDEVFAQIFYYTDPYLIKCLSRKWREEIECTYQEYLNEIASKFQGKSSSLAKNILAIIENHNECKNDVQPAEDSLSVFRHIEHLITKELEQKPECESLLQNNRDTYGRDCLKQVIDLIDLLDDYNLVQFFSLEPDIWNSTIMNQLNLFIIKRAEDQNVSFKEMPALESSSAARKPFIRSQAEFYRDFLKTDGPFCPVITLNTPLVELPSEVKFMSGLKFMRIHNSHLTSLPSEIGHLTRLVILDLGRNKLTNLPREVGSFTNLTKLDLSHNKLSFLPSEFGKFTKLEKLDLSFNELSSLPCEMGKLTALQQLDLSYNKLSSLPSEILQLQNLALLFLSHNQLSSLQNIKQLPARTIIRMNGNPLSSFQKATLLFYRNIMV